MTQNDELHLATAAGFIQREEWHDAHAALQCLEPEQRTSARVLAMKVSIFQGLEEWEMMETAARMLALRLPDETQWMVTWAFALRKFQGDEKADGMLADYLAILPNNAATHYFLGKHALKLGDPKTARLFLTKAFELSPALRSRAIDDKELGAYWDAK